MKCFEIREPRGGEVRPGIEIGLVEGPWGVELGLCREKVLPLWWEAQNAIQAALDNGHLTRKEGIPLLRADLTQDMGLCRERAPSTRALVLMATPAGLGGTRQLTAGTWDEMVERGRVTRMYHPFQDAVGVHVAEEVVGDPWATQLLVLDQGAQFRVVRSGALNGRPAEFRVLWTGSHLRMVVPFHERSRNEHRAQA